jgi:hypothetical protein
MTKKRHIVAVLLSILLVFVFLFDVYLLMSIVAGTQVVRAAETSAGRSLNCYELYETGSIEAYFYPERALQGDTLYLSGILLPVWLGISIGLPLSLTVVFGRRQRWHWLPVILMTPLILALVLHLGMLNKLVCALE